jgi:RecA/RadA recombinase
MAKRVSEDRIKEQLRKKEERTIIPAEDYLSTGSYLLNKALTGYGTRGYAKGLYYFFVGDSSSGKTWYTLTCLAEAARNKNFDDYDFVFDQPERGALMDMRRYFGEAMFLRIRGPYPDDPTRMSETTDEFIGNVKRNVTARPCIYILDSSDVLTTRMELSKWNTRINTATDGKIKGQMTDGKAKDFAQGIRQLLPLLLANGSILIIICQTRDNMDAGPFEPQKTRSGGNAIKFYAAGEIWTSIAGRIKKKVHGKDRQIGITSRAKVKKNRTSGKEWDVDVPFYYDYGIDDIGSMVNFLLSEKHWKTQKAKGEGEGDGDSEGSGNPIVEAKDFDFTGRKDALVKHIEEEGLEADLRTLVDELWTEIEEACSVKRKPRYV